MPPRYIPMRECGDIVTILLILIMKMLPGIYFWPSNWLEMKLGTGATTLFLQKRRKDSSRRPDTWGTSRITPQSPNTVWRSVIRCCSTSWKWCRLVFWESQCNAVAAMIISSTRLPSASTTRWWLFLKPPTMLRSGWNHRIDGYLMLDCCVVWKSISSTNNWIYRSRHFRNNGMNKRKWNRLQVTVRFLTRLKNWNPRSFSMARFKLFSM